MVSMKVFSTANCMENIMSLHRSYHKRDKIP